MSRVGGLIGDFARATMANPAIEPDVIAALVDLKRDYLDDAHPARWRVGDLTELLLEIFPRKVTADDEWIAVTVPTVREFLTYADKRGRLHRSSDDIEDLLAELDAVAPQYVSAMGDTGYFGLAKSIFANAAAGGVDLSDEGAMQAFQAQFNALPQEQRQAITDPAMSGFGVQLPEPSEQDEPMVLPAIRLPARAELADAARRSLLLGRAVQLARWVGARKQVTGTGVLRVADAKAAAVALGLQAAPGLELAEELELTTGLELGTENDEDPASQFRSAQGIAAHKVRSARDIAELHLVWTVAVEIELVAVGRTMVTRGEGWQRWERAADDDVLDLWTGACAVILNSGVAGTDELDYWLAEHEAVETEVVDALPEMYLGEELSIEQLVADMVAVATQLHAGIRPGPGLGEAVPGDDPVLAWRRVTIAALLGKYLDRLVDLGALTVTDDTVSMTPLGRWGLHEELVEQGLTAPLVIDPASLDARTLLLDGGHLSPDELDVAVEDWLQARQPQAAAAELVDAARVGGSMVRTTAFALLDERLAFIAPVVLADSIDDPVIGRHARAWLESAGMPSGPPLSPQDMQWLAVDGVAAILAAMAGLGAVGDLPDETWQLFDEQVLGELWQVDHPDLLSVLEAIGRGHPKGRVRKAAKKAAFKARQRGVSG